MFSDYCYDTRNISSRPSSKMCSKRLAPTEKTFFLILFFYYLHNVTVVMPGSTAVMHFASAQSVVDEKEQSRETTNKTTHVVESLLGFLSPSTGRITKRGGGGGEQDLKYQHTNNLHRTTSIKKKL